jgi:hypothetical protein
MDLHTLEKMPRLIEHYQEHRNRLSDFSILDFLNLHYGKQAGQHEQDERGKHQTLPFKSGGCASSHVLSLVSCVNAFEIATPSFSISYPNFYQSTFSVDFSESIWQPPRV